MPNPPIISQEERREALLKAAQHRKERALFKRELAEGKRNWREALDSQAQSIRLMRVRELLESLPGFGSVRASAILDRIGISQSRRIQGLGSTQRKKLEVELKGR